MAEIDLHRHRLSDHENERIFREDIVADHLSGLSPQQRPVVVFIGGQPGAGKTATTAHVLRSLSERGTPAHVCGDIYKPYHPAYRRLLTQDEATAGAYTRLDARAWHAKAEAYAREQRADVVIETALSGPAGFAEPASAFRAAGYRVEVVALAVPAPVSRLGILTRYAAQVDAHGRGRIVDPENHDTCYTGLAATVAGIDTDRSADAIRIVRRGNETLYINTLTAAGEWADPPRAAGALAAERDRTWTPTEAQVFRAELAQLEARRDPALRSAAAEIARLATPHLGRPPAARGPGPQLPPLDLSRGDQRRTGRNRDVHLGPTREVDLGHHPGPDL
jgi:hypothetical protein